MKSESNYQATQNSKYPFVSAIVVTRNRANSLERTLRALDQLDYPNYEIIVVDNGSTDHTAQLSTQNGIRYIFCPPQLGIGACRQKGVEAAKGEIIAFCDDDCIPVPSWLQHITQRLSNEPDLGLLGGQIVNVGFSNLRLYKGRTKWAGPNGQLAFAKDPDEADFFGNANLAFRRVDIQAIGGYDPFYNARAEIDLAMSFRRHGFRISYEPKALVEHHHTESNYKGHRVFRGQQLMRLYFYLKHCRPNTLSEWIGFAYHELGLVRTDLVRVLRAFGAAIIGGKFERFPSIAVDFFNLLSARLAIPWLLWRVKRQELQFSGQPHQPLHQRPK